jgi:hypothetical protein
MTRRPEPGVPDLKPLRYVDEVVAALALVPVDECEAEVQEAAEAAHLRREERLERAARPWRPPFRCLSCHRYVSTAVSVCVCGHVGADDNEGQRTSYAKAHARRRAA